MAQHVMKNIQCAKRTRFHPRHASGLSNEFCCFANYNINHTDGMKTGENVKEEKEEDDFGWATSEDEEV